MNVRPLVFVAAVSLFACQGGDSAPSKPAGEAPAAERPAAAAHEGHEGHDAHPAAGAGEMKSPGERVGAFFVYPQSGSTVFSPVDVTFGVQGKAVRPAGEDAMDKASGHHHVIIDGGPVDAGQVVPKDETHLHYGGGQTSAEVKLSPGPHSLTMQFADGAHLSYGPDWAQTIELKVVPGGEGRRVYFDGLTDGAEVTSPVSLKFGLEGMNVRPAGEDVMDKTTGHHHLIIDGGPEPLGQAVPADATHIHYGKGQTEATVELTPGEHTLTLQLADGAHLSYGERLSATIKVTVK